MRAIQIMKILRVMGYPLRNSGSLERFMLKLSKELKHRGHDMHLVFDGPRNPELEPFIRELEQSCVIHWFPPPPRKNKIHYLIRSYNLLRTEKYDIVHVYFTPSAPLFSWVAFLLRVPLITRTLGSPPYLTTWDKWFFNLLRKMKWKIAHFPVKKLICVSKTIQDCVVNRSLEKKQSTQVVYASTDTNHYVPPRNFLSKWKALSLQQTIRLTFLGRLEKKNGLENLIMALKPLSIRYSSIRAQIIGDGSLKSVLTDLIQQLGLEHVISLPGRQHNTVEILWETDIYLQPSYMEGCGRAVLEAMSCGVPVIGSGDGGIRETVRNNIDGILVPPGQPEKIEKAVIKLIEDQEFYNRATINARERVTESFDIHVSANKEIELYKRLYSEEVA